jgi:hypothetical protein
MAGKKWTAEQEAQLKTLAESDLDVEEIASKLQKTSGAIIVKCQRLGLPLRAKGYSKTQISLPKELPSIEEALQILAGALRAAVKPGLDRVEVQRLQAIAAISKTYKELLCDFIDYKQIEAKLKEMEQQNAQQQKSSNTSPQPNPPPMA